MDSPTSEGQQELARDWSGLAVDLETIVAAIAWGFGRSCRYADAVRMGFKTGALRTDVSHS
jgi:hypothetical protein